MMATIFKSNSIDEENDTILFHHVEQEQEEEEEEDDEEEEKIVRKSNAIKSAEQLFNIWSLICILKLKSITYKDEVIVRKILTADSSINIFKIIRTNYKSRKTNIFKWIIRKLIQTSILTYSLYIFINILITLFVHYKRDMLLTGWKPKFNLIINNRTTKESYNNCQSLIINEINFDSKEDELRYKSIIETTNLFENTYDLTLLSIGNPLLVYTIHLILLSSLFHFGIIFLTICNLNNTHKNYNDSQNNDDRRIKCDLYAFLFNPNGERLRLKNRINSIYDNIINSLHHTIQHSKLRFDDQENKHESLYLRDKYKFKSSYPSSTSSSSSMRCVRNKFNSQGYVLTSVIEEELKTDIVRFNYMTIYTKLLVQLKKSNLVKLENKSNAWHRWFCRFFNCYVLIASIAIFISTIIFNGGIQVIEIDKCAMIRLEHYRNCSLGAKHYYINNIDNFLEQKTIYDVVYFKILYNIEDEKTYLSNDIINLDYMELFLIEMKFYFKRNDMIFKSILVHLNGLLSSFYISFYTAIYLLSHLDKLIWINGIQKDLNDCISSLKELNASSRKDKYLGAHESEFNINLYRSICSVYVNYELFRKEHHKFLRLATMLIHQAILTCFLSMLSVYVIGSSIRIDSNFVLLLMLTYIIGYVNCVFLLSAVLTNKLKNFILLITKMLAEVRLIKLRFCHIFDLWQRELMTPREIESFYSPSVLGIHPTFNTVVTMNYYLVFLWILVFRNSYENRYSSQV